MSQTVGPLEIMALPLAECLVLVGIHSYLGIHVLRRQVIFVDLALAQIAALGSTIAFLFAMDPLSPGAWVFSVLATLAAAGIFSFTRFRRNLIPQEAIIGLVYALAAALGILLVARAPHGAEHIQKVLTGDLLWVQPREVLIAAGVYAGVGLFHFLARDRFLAISEDPDAARARGINLRLWDFLFYASFGLVITLSVRTAGVLLVFVFLVIPAMTGVLLTTSLTRQLLIGWTTGVLVSIAGLGISYGADTSTGPTVVALYGLVLVLVAVGAWLKRSPDRPARKLTHLAAGITSILVFAALLQLLGTWMGASPFWRGDHQDPAPQHPHEAHEHAADSPKAEETCEGDCPAHRLLHQLGSLDITEKTARVDRIQDPLLVEELLVHVGPDNDEMKLVLALRLTTLGRSAGPKALLELLQSPIPLIRSEAWDGLADLRDPEVNFDPWDEPTSQANQSALQVLKQTLSSLKTP